MTYKEVKYGLGSVSVGDYQPIYDSEDVCNYVSKHIGYKTNEDFLYYILKNSHGWSQS